ncbi:hypothetical protein ABPG72_017104 [Tetrahymena utriculariae]
MNTENQGYVNKINHSDISGADDINTSLKQSLNQQQDSRRSQLIQQKITFEEALDLVGSANWYQLRAFIWFGLQWFWCAWILLQSNFIFMDPEYNCPSNISASDCDASWVCDQTDYMQYIVKNDNSLIFYYDPPLVCDRGFIYSIMSALTYLGSLIGFFFFSWYADNKGRKNALLWSWLIATFGTFMVGFSQKDIVTCSIGLFLQGLGANPAITIHFSFLNEHSQGPFREYTSIGVQIFFAAGECFLILAAYLIPYWRWLVLFAFGIPVTILNFGIFLIQESPKFLHEQSTEKAIGVLNKIAKVNKKEPLKLDVLKSVLKTSDKENSYSVVDLFKFKSLRVKNICCAIVFLAIQMVYYGITFAISQVGFNIYINSLVIGLCELFAYCVTDHFIPKIKRKITTLIGIGIVTALSFSFVFLTIPDSCSGSTFCYQKVIQIILAGSMRFVICFVWTVVYIWIAELFPTTVRNLALGFSSALGTIGSTAAPFMKTLCQNLSISPMIPLGVIGIAGVACSFPLSETRGQKLQDQIEEIRDPEFEEHISIQKEVEIQDEEFYDNTDE